MQMSDNKYYRIYNGNSKNAWMVQEEEIKKYEGKKSYFVSTCFYTEEQFQNFQKTKTVAGIRDVKTNQLWFDFDSDNLENSRNDAKELIKRILSYKTHFNTSNLEYYFSGSKGWHIVLKLKNEYTPVQIKKIVENLGKNLTTLDMKVYDANRILRMPNTQHEKTGLFKVQLNYDEFENRSLDEIKNLAASVRDSIKTEPAYLPKELFVEPQVIEKKRELILDEADPLQIKKIDFTSMPSGWKTYKWSLANGRFEIGKRNHALMVIASTCRALKYGRAHTQAICEAADKLHCEITGDSAVDDGALEREVLDTVFGSSWNGGQYSVDNDLELRNYCEKNGFKLEKDDFGADVIGLQDVNASFKDFVKNIDANTIKTGIARLDKAMPITIGNNVGIIGAASSGKTSIALEILKNTSMNGVVSVIASLDMHRNRLYEKLLYKVSHDVYKKSLSRDELYKKFKDDKDSELVEEIKKQYGNVYFYDRSSPSVSDLRKFVLTVEAQTGQKVKLLMIDYFERIGSELSDATASSLKVANELQDLLNDLNVAIITLVQPNKFSLAGGPDTPILNYTAIKGSSFIYQSFRSIISIWRPFFNAKMKHLDKFLEMAILKNDLGELDHFKFTWEGKTGSVGEMSEENEQQYEEYTKEKKQILTPQQEDPPQFGQFRRSNGPY